MVMWTKLEPVWSRPQFGMQDYQEVNKMHFTLREITGIIFVALLSPNSQPNHPLSQLYNVFKTALKLINNKSGSWLLPTRDHKQPVPLGTTDILATLPCLQGSCHFSVDYADNPTQKTLENINVI